MASGTVCRPVPAPIVWLMICTNGIIGANLEPVHGTLEDLSEPWSCRDEPSEGTLRTSARRINKYSASVDFAAPRCAGQRVDTFFERTSRIAAIERDLGH